MQARAQICQKWFKTSHYGHVGSPCHIWLKGYMCSYRQLSAQMGQNWQINTPLMAECCVCHYWNKIGHQNCSKNSSTSDITNEELRCCKTKLQSINLLKADLLFPSLSSSLPFLFPSLSSFFPFLSSFPSNTRQCVCGGVTG